MALDFLRSTLGMARSVEAGIPDPLETTYKGLRNIQQMRKLQEPTEREKIARREEIESAKFAITKFTDLIKDSGTSPAARENMKEMLSGYAYSLPQALRAAVLPALQHSPISPNQRKLDELDKYFPDPEAPRVPEVTENRGVWASYKWAREKKEFHRNNVLGVEASMRRLMPTEDPSVYSFISPMTKQIGFIDIGKVPQDEIKQAEELGYSLAGIVDRGVVPLEKAGNYTIGDTQWTIQRGRDLRTGDVVTSRMPIGEASGKKKGPAGMGIRGI